MDDATEGENDDRERGPKEEVEKRTTQRAPQRNPVWNQEPPDAHRRQNGRRTKQELGEETTTATT